MTPIKQNEVSFVFVKKEGFKLFAHLETRVKQNKATAIFHKIFPGWNFVLSYEFSTLARIWVYWDPSFVKLTVIDKTEQGIHCELWLLDKDFEIFCFFCVWCQQML